MFPVVGRVGRTAAGERPGERAADGGEAGVLNGVAGWAGAELGADCRREVGVDQRVGDIRDGERSEPGSCGQRLELAVLAPGDG
jgi:hypothetical protein